MDALAQAFGGLIGGALTLAKELGKGGGGSTEEPTVCMALLPFGAAVVYAIVRDVRQRARRRAEQVAQPAAAVGSSAARSGARA